MSQTDVPKIDLDFAVDHCHLCAAKGEVDADLSDARYETYRYRCPECSFVWHIHLRRNPAVEPETTVQSKHGKKGDSRKK